MILLTNRIVPPRTQPMGKVIVQARIENVGDLYNVAQGSLPADQVRSVDVPDAVVDTGASTLALPRRLIAQLGLVPGRTRQARSSGGLITVQIHGPARLTIQGREWTGDVIELGDDCPVLVGQLPLEFMDFLVDPVNGRLIGNPEHGGEQMLELYALPLAPPADA